MTLETKPINSINELIDSNLSYVAINDSWLWWNIENEKRWNESLDNNLRKIASRLQFISEEQLNQNVTSKFYLLKTKFNQYFHEFSGYSAETC